MSILSSLNQLCSPTSEPAEQRKAEELSLFGEGIVVERIEPGGKGRIKLHGVYWNAKLNIPLQWPIPVDTLVTVKGRTGLTLVVEPLIDSSLAGLPVVSFPQRIAELEYSSVSRCYRDEQCIQHVELEAQ